MSKKIILSILIVCFASLTALAFQPQGGAAWKPPKAFKGEIKPWTPPKGVPTPPKTWKPPKTFKHKPTSWDPPKSFKSPPSKPWQSPQKIAPGIIPAEPSEPSSPHPDSTMPKEPDKPAQPDATQPTVSPSKPLTDTDPKKLHPKKTRQTYPNRLKQPLIPPPPPPIKYYEPTPTPVLPPPDTIYPDKTLDPNTDYLRKY